MTIRDYFIETIRHYEGEQSIIYPLWEEIEAAYTAPGRHYHNLEHLEHMLAALLRAQPAEKDRDVLVLALCYHDIVYDPLQHNNEALSADLAVQRLSALSIHKTKVEQVRRLILATQGHTLSDDALVNLFTDADLSILGTNAVTYKQYATAIREEYAVVPDVLYLPGRKKVLEHFLAMPQIYKTDFFRTQYEAQARINLREEGEALM